MMGVAVAESDFSPEGGLTGDKSTIVDVGQCGYKTNTLCGIIVDQTGAEFCPVMQGKALELREAPVDWDLKPSSKGDKWIE